MNLKKVEQILIIAFLALNITLLILLYQRDQTLSTNSLAESLSVSEVMSRNSISLPDFQDENRSLTYLQAGKTTSLLEEGQRLEGQTVNLDPAGRMAAILSDPLEIQADGEWTDQEQLMLDNFVSSGQVLYGSQYHYQGVVPQAVDQAGSVIYSQVFEGVPIGDGTASLTFNVNDQGEIISYTQSYLDSFTKQGDPINLITDRRAAEILYQNNAISAGATIHSVQLVYYRTLDLETSAIYAPAWLVEVETSTEKKLLYVDATSGSLVVPISEDRQGASQED